MHRFGEQIAYYSEMFHHGNVDDSFHGLLELDRDILPELMAVFRQEQDAEVRELLVEVIWQYRDSSVIPFLGEALSDPDPRVWRQALDGLVALASPAGLDILHMARARRFPTVRETKEFCHWLEDAIDQAEKVMQDA